MDVLDDSRVHPLIFDDKGCSTRRNRQRLEFLCQHKHFTYSETNLEFPQIPNSPSCLLTIDNKTSAQTCD